MLTVTDTAKEKIAGILKARAQDDAALRIQIVGRGIESFAYDLSSTSLGARESGDLVVSAGEFEVVVDAQSAPNLEDAVIDFDAAQNGFTIENPNPVWPDETGKTIARVIIEQINPSIASHGGAILPVDVQDGILYVRMFGGCQGCGMASFTLTEGVQKAIKEAVPEIQQVVDVTHHAAGTNPYYQGNEPAGE